MKLFVLAIGTLICTSISAQWRVQFQTGLSNSLRPQNTDSVFAAKSQGINIQLRAEYYAGHAGLGIAAGYITQSVKNDVNRNPPPSFLNQLDSFSVTGAGLQSFYLLAGPEFCFACGKKVKLNFGIRGGISLLKNESLQITGQNVLRYRNVITSKAPFTFNMGIGGHYFITEHFGIGAKLDYHAFKVKYANNDFRNGINNTTNRTKLNNYLNTALSLTYKL